MKLNMAKREALTAYLFIAPLVLGFILWNIGPLIASLGLSFTDYNLLEPPKFVLFDNYAALFDDDIFPIAFKNTLIYALVTVPLGLVVSLILAMIMNQGVPGTALFRTIFFIPSVCAIVAIALVWQWIYDSDLGILNYFLTQVGLPKFQWLQDKRLALPAIMAMSIWQGAGYTDLFGWTAGSPCPSVRGCRDRRGRCMGALSPCDIANADADHLFLVGRWFHWCVSVLRRILYDDARWPQLCNDVTGLPHLFERL
jgi:ABC-type polysaccharide transport system permease subunit